MRGAGSVRVVGHPFGPLGISRVARCTFASLRAAGMQPSLVDVWGDQRRDAVHERSLGRFVTRELGDVNIFHLNGDEIEGALERLGGLPSATRNICFPMWELPRYPREWAQQLDRFDEVWAGSRFIADSIGAAASVPVFHAPVATEAVPTVFRGRRYFGIPESAYAFLFFLDLRSYEERKNPRGVIEAFRAFVSARPWAQTCLVVKVHGTANAPEAAEALRRNLAELGSRAVLIDRQMDEDEVHALVYACDAFVSLHRAEGYGLGLAEAMSLGRPVIGTAYSGNLDFMNADVARMVDYELVAVPSGAYPQWEDQTWADPDIAGATRHMTDLYDDPASGRELGRRAARHMRVSFSFRACGLRYRERIESFFGQATDG